MDEEEKSRHKKKVLTGILFLLITIFLLWNYWFVPFNEIEFQNPKKISPEFTIGNLSNSKMQFYENMRYPDKNISYKIKNCPLQKQNEVEQAIKILKNKTILDFYPVQKNEDIYITCNQKIVMNEDYFVAGEGGPTNITKAGNFHVITHGRVLLLRESKCPDPVIPIHELLHALGFIHSENPHNIMYNFSRYECDQEIGKEIPLLIRKLYEIPNYPDLIIKETKPKIHERYLDANITIKNYGLSRSPKSNLTVYSDKKEIYRTEIESLDIGYGIEVLLKNIKLEKFNFEKIRFVIDSGTNELETSNNEIIFEKK